MMYSKTNSNSNPNSGPDAPPTAYHQSDESTVLSFEKQEANEERAMEAKETKTPPI
jgi:hypothetical protein